MHVPPRSDVGVLLAVARAAGARRRLRPFVLKFVPELRAVYCRVRLCLLTRLRLATPHAR